jgi:hypothetical protein
MSASTPAEFVALVPTAGFSFDDFGNATQGDVDDLKNQQFPGDLASRIKLQSIWARHPNRQGEKRRCLLRSIRISTFAINSNLLLSRPHIILITSLCLPMPLIISPSILQ